MDSHTHPIDSPAAWADADVAPGAGTGTLARLGRVVLLVGSTEPGRVGPLLEQAAMVAANGGEGRQLVRGFALQLSTTADDHPSFVALAPHETGLAVFVQGDAAVVTINGDRISGADSLAWVERLVPWPIEQLEASVDAAAGPGGALFRLTDGVVPAGGFTVSGAHDHGPAMVAVDSVPAPPPVVEQGEPRASPSSRPPRP